MIEVWADPKLTRNTHRIEVDADSASFGMMIENIPSENPKTGRITALSIISCLRKLTAPLRVGGSAPDSCFSVAGSMFLDFRLVCPSKGSLRMNDAAPRSEEIRLRFLKVDTSNVADVLDDMDLPDQGFAADFKPYPASAGKLAGWAYTIRGRWRRTREQATPKR